jgi:signal transduction histidine kinase
VLAALCGSLICLQHFHPLAFRAPTLRAIIETEITLSALAAACLFAVSFGHRRRLRDVLFVAALVQVALIDLVSYVIPAAISIHPVGLLTAAPMLAKLFMAATVAAAVIAPASAETARTRKPLALAIGGGVLCAAVAELGGLLFPRGASLVPGGPGAHGISAALSHPVGFWTSLIAAALLVVAAVRLVREDCSGRASVTMLLAAGIIVFAAARLNSLALPTSGIGWVTPREALWVAGYALLLAAALRQEATVRRAIGHAAAAEERRRIARDLHDGLAQDLAFIAAHGDRMAREAGHDHPLAIAARRALAVSRGAIADLAASDAPSAGAALRRVADELEVRFGVQVRVDADDTELSPGARDDVIRIVREAIVNAAHAQARTIAVSLARHRNRYVLRVLDDGNGIDSGDVKARPGFGLRSMRERAASLGGGMSARPASGGGTELEVVFP